MLKRTLFKSWVMLLFVLSSINLLAQSIEPCGFDKHHHKMLLNDPAYAQRVDDFNESMKHFTMPKVSNALYQIPVVVHVMELGNSLTDITDEQIRGAIQKLNEDYRNVYPDGTDVSDTVDLKIEFSLAVRDPSGNCTNGIDRVDMSGVSGYNTNGVNSDLTGGISDLSLKNYSRWDPTQYYNIWLVSEIDNNEGGAGIQGYAYFASSHGSTVDGAVILVNNFKDPSSGTTAHELGHAYNLYHTFEGDGTGGTCPTNTSCSTQGDRVCDTPPHRRSSSDCNTDATNTCTGGSTNDYVHNYMDYSSDACQHEFTNGQRTRVLAAMTGTRSSFLASNGNMSLVPPTSASVAFISDKSIACAGESIQFFDRSSCTPNTYLDTTNWSGISFSWTFTNGANVYTSNLQNPIMTFPVAGAYDVSLTVTNAFGTTSYTESSMVVVAGAVASSCTPNSTNNANYAQTVYEVNFNTISNTTSSLVNYGYTDYTCDFNTIVTDGNTYSLSVSIRAGGSGAEYTRVYIDYNNNGVWEASELVLSGNTAANTTNTVSANVTIPGTAVQNSLLRMRVWGETFSDITASELTCSANLTIGDVEDYGVYILPSCIAPLISTQPSNATICENSDTSFGVVATGTTIGYQWQVSTNGGGSWSNISDGAVYSGTTSAELTLISVPTSYNTYRYRCVLTNSCGSQTSNGGILTVNANPVLSVPTYTDPSACGVNDGNIQVSSTGTGTLSWTGPVSSSAAVASFPYTINSLGSGNYTLSFVNSNGCTSNEVVQILSAPSSPAAPTISADGPLTFCDGGSVTLTSSYASGNTWSTTETTQSITVSESGEYTVTYTDGGGCTATSAITTVTVNPTPAAPTITVIGSEEICPGGSTDLSSSEVANNVWSTTETTQVITVSTAGSYSVHFTDANGCISLESAPVTITNYSMGPLATLPFSEGFTGVTFVPTNWTLIDGGAGGNGNTANTTWQRSASVGVAPTAGNSMMFDNANFDDRPEQDEVHMQPMDLSGFSNVQMTFDVAYARYSASYFDGLQVLVSNDCGVSFTSVYSKSGSTLATAADNTGLFTPAAGEWRTETIDLSAYDGTEGLIIAFRNLAGWGNRLFVDNINLSGTEVPVANFTATQDVCEGGSVTFTNTSTGTPTSYSWSFPGGSPASSIATNPTVTYSTAGTYNVSLIATNAAGSDTEVKTGFITVHAPSNSSETITACDTYTWPVNSTTYSVTGTYSEVLADVYGCDSTVTLNLTINNSTSGTETISACDSYTWSANSITYTSSGTYSALLTGSNGCDSTATLVLTINTATSGSESVTACDSYTWSANSTTYTVSGTYTALLTGSNGCDSTATLNLTINTATSGSESITACDSYTWSANSTTYTVTGTYTALLTGSNGCDSTATLNLTINNPTSGSESITACDMYTWPTNGMNYFTSGIYTATLTAANGCDSMAILDLTIYNSETSTEDVTACDSYTWPANSTTYNTSGTYTSVLTTMNGCDSVVTLNLTINNSTSGTESIAACGSYTWSANSTTYSVSGTYTALLTGSNGCDSTAILNLTINNATSGSESVTACDSYTWSANSATYSFSGSYTALLTGTNGCDSTATLNLTINNSTSGSESVTACDMYTWPTDGLTYFTSGLYSAILTGANGCDSVAYLNLTINNSTSGTETVNACDSYTWSANGTTYTSSGTYTALLTGSNGCDSTAILNLTINTATSGSESVTACGSYTWSANSTTYTVSGTYTALLTGSNGCDSTATLILTMSSVSTSEQFVTACDTYTWTTNSVTYTTSGDYSETLLSSQGCDSIVTLHLTINNSTTGSESIIACDSYTWPTNSTTYTSSGVYTALLVAANGCDSIATLNLTINNSTSGTEALSACNSYTWSANSTTYTVSGTYTALLTGSNGCDSTAILNLTINTPTSGSEAVTACGSYTWSANSMTYTTSGTYTALLTGSNGCDSTATLNLTINNVTSGSESVTACGSYTWSANSTTYTVSGTYTALLTGSNGCDSTATLNLTINNATSGTESVTACGSYTWPTNSTTYTVSGTYTVLLTGSNGCDSTAILNLTINNPTSGSESVTACGSYTWSANSATYSVSGTYTALLTGSNGCDSTAILNLTINNATSGSESVTACGSYTWSANSTTYAASGTYTALLIGSNGCDSTATLNLTINNTTSGSESVTTCGSYTWSANSTTYTTSGTYTAILTGANGCDSTATLVLTINTATSGSESAVACGSFTWSANSTTYTTSGTYTTLLSGSNGCDSTAILNLIINNATSGSESVSACGSYTWLANSTTYTTSGTYTALLTGSNGCDSTAILNLTINNATSGSESVTVCDSYTWSANSTTYTTSGTYTALLAGVNGCDSTATLNLTINATPSTPTISTSGTSVFCEGGSVTLTSSSATNNMWSTSETTQSIVVTTSGTYTVTVSNGACSATSSPTTVVVNPLPTVTIDPLSDMCINYAVLDLVGGSPAGGTYTGPGVFGSQFDPSQAGQGTWTINYSYTDGNGCSNSASTDIYVDSCVGVDELAFNYVIYPNPSMGLFTVKSEQNLTSVKVFDYAGKLIYINDAIHNSIQTVDLQNYADGVYHIELMIDNQVQRTRIILNK